MLSRAFYSIQYPIADLRPFIPGAPRLTRPEFLWPRYESDFVRSVGQLVPRPEGGVAPWAGEETYVRASNAVRFAGDLRDAPLAASLDSLTCAFRRMHTDGGPVTRVEVALWGRPRDGKAELGTQLREFLATPVRVRDGIEASWGAPVDLVAAGAPMARHLLRARAPMSESGDQPWWVAAGDPAIIIEHAQLEQVGVPTYAKALRAFEQQHITIHHWHLAINGVRARVWMIGYDRDAPPEVLRELRIHLSRLHAERQCLGQVLRTVATRQMEFERGSGQSEDFQAYLLAAAHRLLRRDALNIDQTEILAAAEELSDLVEVGQRDSLLALIRRIRPNVIRQIERLIEREQTRAHVIQVYVEGDYVGEQVIIKDNVIYNGNLVVAKTIENSFNVMNDSGADDALKAQLEELHVTIGTLAEKLDPAKAEQVARDLKSFTEEVTSPEPRRKWYEVSGEGLVEAAKAVVDIAPKVAGLVASIVKFLTVGPV